MASFQIHIDRENQVSNVRRLPDTKNTVGLHQKRSVLGNINSNSTIGLSRKPLKQDEKKKNAVKSTKPSFTIQEDKLEEGAQAVLQAIKEDKEKKEALLEKKEVLLEKKEVLLEKKEVLAKKEIEIKDGCKQKLPASITSLPQQPLKEISQLTIKESAEDRMSECSFVYDEFAMSIDKSVVCKSPTVVKSYIESIYDLDDYRDDIFKYLLESEDRNRPKAYYMRRQPDVTYAMRTILVDWLVEVTQEYHLHSETLHIAIYIIDRFLSLMSVVRGKLQLLGTAAMFIASKYEEIYPPDVGEFVYITDETYSKDQMLRMEHLILKVLMFDISVPTCLSFIQIICVSCKQSEKVKQLASFLCELTLLEGDPYLSYLPSNIASAALALARYCLDEEEPWSFDLAKFTGLSLSSLSEIIGHLNDTHARSKSIPHQSIQDKYKSRKLQSVSDVPHKPLIVFPV